MLGRPPDERTSLRNEVSLDRRAARAERQRRHRQRRAEGEACTTVQYDADDLDKMVRLGVLRECEAGDREAIGLAIRQVLKNVRL